MRHTVILSQKLITTFPRANGPAHHIGGAFRALDNAPERSVYVKVHPRPRSLDESQQILQELKKFGEIEVYRNLKYDFDAPAPNSLFVVYRDETAALRAQRESKIQFHYADPSVFTRQQQQQSSVPSPGNRNTQIQSQTPSLPSLLPDLQNEPHARPGELIIRRGTLQHLSHIQRQFYYWPVEVRGLGNPGAAMLGGLPPGMHGLRDFDVRRGEHGMRRRDGMSFRWEGRVRERGWERLEELWGLGRREREQKGEC